MTGQWQMSNQDPLEGKTKEKNGVDTGAMENCHTQGEWEVFLIMGP